MRLNRIKYHPNGNPVGQQPPNRGKKRHRPMLRHKPKNRHLQNTKYKPNQRTDMPNKINLFLTYLQKHPHHQRTVAFHLVDNHLAHINQVFDIVGQVEHQIFHDSWQLLVSIRIDTAFDSKRQIRPQRCRALIHDFINQQIQVLVHGLADKICHFFRVHGLEKLIERAKLG